MARPKAENGVKKPSQKTMVQAALDGMGWNSEIAELQTFIKETFATELKTNVISNYKSIIKRTGGKPKGTRGRPRAAQSGYQMQDLEVVQGLVSRLGATNVKALVDFLA